MSEANPDQPSTDRAGLAITVPYWLGGDHKAVGAARSMVLRVNFNKDGTVREVFARPFKTGADLEGLLDKFCIGVSRALKFGDTIENFWACVDGKSPIEGQDIFTAVVRGAVMLEREMLGTMATLVQPAPALVQPGTLTDEAAAELKATWDRTQSGNITGKSLLHPAPRTLGECLDLTGIDEPPPGTA